MKKAEPNPLPPTRAELLRMAALTGLDVRTVERVIDGTARPRLATQKLVDDAWSKCLRDRKVRK
jgi:hypothetical protein